MEYILGNDLAYSAYHRIYSESMLKSMLNYSIPVIIARGWYDEEGNRHDGHTTIIYGYHWDENAGIYVYDIYDPLDVNEGDSYSRSYQWICNGRNATSTEPIDTGIWESIITYKQGPYARTIAASLP